MTPRQQAIKDCIIEIEEQNRSVMAIELQNKIQAQMNCSPRVPFEISSYRGLVQYVLSRGIRFAMCRASEN